MKRSSFFFRLWAKNGPNGPMDSHPRSGIECPPHSADAPIDEDVRTVYGIAADAGTHGIAHAGNGTGDNQRSRPRRR